MGPYSLKLSSNNHTDEEGLSKKYASVIYGSICRFTGDETLAKEIFHLATARLKGESFFLPGSSPVLPRLLRYIYSFTAQHFTDLGLAPLKPKGAEESGLLSLLCSSCKTIDEAAGQMDINTNSAKKLLRDEFLHLRKVQALHTQNTSRLVEKSVNPVLI